MYMEKVRNYQKISLSIYCLMAVAVFLQSCSSVGSTQDRLHMNRGRSKMNIDKPCSTYIRSTNETNNNKDQASSRENGEAFDRPKALRVGLAFCCIVEHDPRLLNHHFNKALYIVMRDQYKLNMTNTWEVKIGVEESFTLPEQIATPEALEDFTFDPKTVKPGHDWKRLDIVLLKRDLKTNNEEREILEHIQSEFNEGKLGPLLTHILSPFGVDIKTKVISEKLVAAKIQQQILEESIN